MREFTATLLGGPACTLGEGPYWDGARGELGWVDILGRQFHHAPIDEGGRLGAVMTRDVPEHLGAAVPVGSGGWLLAVGTGFSHLGDDGTLRTLAQPEAGFARHRRMNDAKCDPAGRLWAGSMTYDEALREGSLYRVDPDGSVRTMLTGTGVSNGLAWDERGMYFNDSAARTVTGYDHEAGHGHLIADGFAADGMAIDTDGTLWIAHWDGGEVRQYGTDGTQLGVVHVPVARTSSCAFSGPRGDLLVITTGIPDGGSDPDAGRLFAARVGATGLPATPYAGKLPCG